MGGFGIAARFKRSRQGLVGVKLTVSAPDDQPEGLVAEFFLHDTFRPSHLQREFSGRRAVLEFDAGGGFTVGVWIPSLGIELELDLAKDPHAPRIIREL